MVKLSLAGVPSPLNGERTVSSTNGVGKTGYLQAKAIKWNPYMIYKNYAYLIQYTKINSKRIKNQMVRPKTIRLLEENIEERLHDMGFGNDLLDMMSKT